MIFDLCQTGREFDWVSVPSFTHDVKRRIPATDKAQATLAFEAEVKLEDGLKEVVDWLRQARPSANQVASRS
jgi:nucleoside-diphosphate-sugar epimerase